MVIWMRRLVLAGIVLLSLLILAVPVAAGTVQGDIDYGSTSYIKVDITSGNPQLPTANNYPGWCVEKDVYIYIGPTYTFNLYSSLDEPVLGILVDWHRINWILNNKGSFTPAQIQDAIWYFDGGGVAKNALAQAALDDPASVNFVPQCGQVYALILEASGGDYQIIFVEDDTPSCTQAPEFPTLAVPMGTLVAVGYAVMTVRSRKTHE